MGTFVLISEYCSGISFTFSLFFSGPLLPFYFFLRRFTHLYTLLTLKFCSRNSFSTCWCCPNLNFQRWPFMLMPDSHFQFSFTLRYYCMLAYLTRTLSTTYSQFLIGTHGVAHTIKAIMFLKRLISRSYS